MPKGEKTKTSTFIRVLESIVNGQRLRKQWPLVLVLLGVTASFFYGWYFDGSMPTANYTWADQRTYAIVTERFAHGELPKADELHFSIGYSLLGVIGRLFITSDPFMLISLTLLLASAIFCFMAVKELYGIKWAVLFSLLLFVWDGVGRSFHFASELFVAPWNNQVLFFTVAYFFWLFVTKVRQPPSWKLTALTGLVGGLSFLVREETILFILPFTAIYLFLAKTDWRKALIVFALILISFLPMLLIKAEVLGGVASSGRRDSYAQVKNQYLQPSLLHRNAWETIIDSKHFEGVEPGRLALFQAAPWLWLSPLGILIIMWSRRYPRRLKAFVLISFLIIVFYLSGANMSAHKLRFHCLRYISSGFIVLNLGTLVVIRETFERTTGIFNGPERIWPKGKI